MTTHLRVRFDVHPLIPQGVCGRYPDENNRAVGPKRWKKLMVKLCKRCAKKVLAHPELLDEKAFTVSYHEEPLPY